ncbi:asparaginase [Herbihabitans rhizosphaerae]|uniref:Asparaginase n=1 Tax=Herbihabitans rhizosphaerae TaxID=1872711 RepID=A0A4Q7KGL2_9PSEU|nr:asparaginase [Herbihabitans rhizosphaerae]RZS32387.1 asparaginase [Herbihabitans rhizosphaerae]
MPDPWRRLAEVRRSGFLESVHFGSVVGLDPDGSVAVSAGPIEQPILPRSSLKPLQALGCLAAGAPLADERVAIVAGSHTGEDYHVETAGRMLADAGLDESALRCPETWPQDERTHHELVRSGQSTSRIRMNCSGKHAGMLSACVASGWPTESYLDADHPLQQVIHQTVADLAEESIGHTAVDGCGAPVFAISLLGLARSFRSLAESTVGDAMRAFPEYVAGTGHVNTELMRLLPGVIVKGGAEGVIALATAEGHAVAVKVIDGGNRATTVIALAVLRALGVDTAPAKELSEITVLGGGQPVGKITAVEKEWA